MIDYGIKGKVALITGANNPQGIGAATVFAFAQQGAKVVLVYKREPRDYDETKTDSNGTDRYFKANAGSADVVAAKLQEAGAECLVLESDISNEEQVKEIYRAALERFGRVDILVNNAASCDMEGIDNIGQITQGVIDDTFAVNVRGSLLMTREFVNSFSENSGNCGGNAGGCDGHAGGCGGNAGGCDGHGGGSGGHTGCKDDLSRWGRVINLSTDSAQVFPGQITYGASKATLEAVTRSIAIEVAKYGITVNCVAPGPTQTGWIDEDLEKAVIPMIPAGELIQPEDIAQAILFLASEQARMITGQVIKVSGGHAL